MSLDYHDPQPLYAWKCLACDFEDHGDNWRHGGHRITPRQIELYYGKPKECPHCGEKTFQIVELDPNGFMRPYKSKSL